MCRERKALWKCPSAGRLIPLLPNYIPLFLGSVFSYSQDFSRPADQEFPFSQKCTNMKSPTNNSPGDILVLLLDDLLTSTPKRISSYMIYLLPQKSCLAGIYGKIYHYCTSSSTAHLSLCILKGVAKSQYKVILKRVFWLLSFENILI